MVVALRIEIDWRLVDDRMAAVRLAVEDETVELSTTYVADSFSSLIRAAVDIKIGSSATYAVLAGEPAGSIMFFSCQSERVRIDVISFSAMSAAFTRFSSGGLRWRCVVSRQGLVKAMREMGEAVRKEYGEPAFERSWGHPFPAEELAKLR